MKKTIKSLLIGKSKRPYQIRYGVASGIKMNIDPDGGSLRILGLDESELLPYVKKFALRCDIFLDVGSSDGYYPLVFRKYNHTGTIYSVEVQQIRAAEQTKNFDLNEFSIDKLHIVEKFISDHDDQENQTIDNLVQVTNKKVLIKIDIEGAELRALNGAENLLRNNHCYLIIETHSKELEIQCQQKLQILGYKTQIVSPAWYRIFIPESRHIAHNRWLIAEKS